MILILLVILNFILMILIITRKTAHKKTSIKKQELSDYIVSVFPEKAKQPINKNLFFEICIDLSQNCRIDEGKMRLAAEWAVEMKLDRYYRRKLKSPLSLVRMESASKLGYLKSEENEAHLCEAFKKEKKKHVKLIMADALTQAGYSKGILPILDSLPDAPEWYRNRICSILADFGGDIMTYAGKYTESRDVNIQMFFCQFAGILVHPVLRAYLHEKIQSENEEIVDRAFDSLASLYPRDLLHQQFLTPSSLPCQSCGKYVLKSITRTADSDEWKLLLPYLFNPETRDEAVYSLSTFIRKYPEILAEVIRLFQTEEQDSRRETLSAVLSNHIETLFIRLLSMSRKETSELIREILVFGKLSNVIGFLNKNRNRELENEILKIMRSVLSLRPELETELRTYLDQRILAKMELDPLSVVKEKKDSKREKDKIIFLIALLSFTCAFLPLVYIIRRFSLLHEISKFSHFKLYVIDFNYYLGYYSIAINSIYILLLLLSLMGMTRQYRYWKLKKNSYLFRKNILPSVSIIAPAYCEEATILESTNSLLNLNYPDYELIIVNDGSGDNTLNTLIEYFKLEKVDAGFHISLESKPVRGLYLNKMLPKLIVVDKANGGKADSLNAGINISRKEFFCGIDADSLLEPDALLKVAAMALNSDKETVAVGGNILPINGCRVDKGHILKTAIPANNIARFQTIEYIRSFMAGRVGWAFIDCLLIISGAFGLFNKKRIVEIGGYLTSSGKYHKDTVGEDMELVVRLVRHMKELKIPAKVQYSFNANCWTEVPESFSILYKQRDRWHRGLIDILTFHKKLIFNPMYRETGLIALPYFFIFELIGPLFEIQGYIMVVMAFFLGLLNSELALFLFIATILMGITVSLASLWIAEREVSFFSVKDSLVLICFAFFENFGFRQVMSFIRVMGFFNSMKSNQGWGKMVRKGFSSR